ncbi:MAG: voltage-gated potassium channel [Natronomonas sp.]|jgi:voltage-gated potassium channel
MAGTDAGGDDRDRRYVGARVTVLLTSAVAILSVLTGIVKISQVTVLGPLAPYIPVEARDAVGFTGALTGFLMLGSALGLRRRLRAAWYSTVVLLPLTAIQGLVQTSVYSLPLVGLSLLSLPSVLFSRRYFDRQVSLSTAQRAAATALASVLAYGTVGTYALRDQFRDVGTLTDAFYFTLVTASTVGYGDITPAPDSELATLFAMSVLVAGTASFAATLGTLLGPLIEARLARALGRMTQTQLDLLEDHVLVLGYGELTDPILDEFIESSVTVVVLTEDGDRAAELGQRDVNVLTDDPGDENALERAGLADARAVVVATEDDAEDALSVLTARQLRPDVRIVAAATDRENVHKLRRAGADTVISPTVIGGHMLVQSALEREDMEAVANQILGREK